MHPDVLIIGGGAIGLTTAYHLAREGVRVAVADQGDLGRQASWAGAGILPPGNPLHATKPLDRLRAISVATFPTLSLELRERTGIDNEYTCCGGIEFVGEGIDAPFREWREEGILFEGLEADRLARLIGDSVEGFKPPAQWSAYYLPDMAQLRNPRHLNALIAACASLGVVLRPHCPVWDVERHGDRVVSAKTANGAIWAGRFLVAAGAWTDQLLLPFARPVGIRPIRGQIALLKLPRRIFSVILLHGREYMVPRADGYVLVGSTEEDVGFDQRTTAAAIRKLLHFAVALVPPLAEASVERCWSGFRPASRDELPFLGVVPGFANLYIAAGHFRAGIYLSPATALVMTELLLGRPTTVPLDSFRVDRSTG